MPSSKHPLRLNVGFIIHADIGYTRQFEFEVDSLDLDSDFQAKNIVGTAKFSRTQSGLLVESSLTTQIDLDCARCLDPFTHDLALEFTELYAFHEKNTTESELLVPKDEYIDLTPLIQDFIVLSIPINPICKPDCAGLCPICGTNHNHSTCDCKIENIDPRLASLKDLLDKEEE